MNMVLIQEPSVKKSEYAEPFSSVDSVPSPLRNTLCEEERIENVNWNPFYFDIRMQLRM